MEFNGERGGVRAQTLEWAESLGLPISSGLPEIDAMEPVRSSEQTAARLLCLYVTAVVGYGCDPDLGMSWLRTVGLDFELSDEERDFITGPDHPRQYADGCIEAIWALCWAVSVCDSLQIEAADCPDDLIKKMPSVREPSTGRAFIDRAVLRPAVQLRGYLDRAYYLHWLAVDAALNRRGPVSPGDAWVGSRRHALEWLFNEESWDDTPLDT